MPVDLQTQMRDHIARIVAAAPPISGQQRARLASLLRSVPSAQSGGRAA